MNQREHRAAHVHIVNLQMYPELEEAAHLPQELCWSSLLLCRGLQNTDTAGVGGLRHVPKKLLLQHNR